MDELTGNETMTKKKYTDEQIASLSNDPNIRDIRPDRLRFTLKFRQEMYDAVKDDIRYGSISAYLKKKGYSIKLIGKYYPNSLAFSFRKHGRPKNENRIATSKMYHHDKSDDEVLLKTGKFERARKGWIFRSKWTGGSNLSGPGL